MGELVLASASPRRAELLKQIGISFKVIPSDLDENLEEGLSTHEFARKLAYDKALSVAQSMGNNYKGKFIVIGADTIVVKEGILGKPKDEEEAWKMLKALQGSWHEVITGVAVIEYPGMKTVSEYEKTHVKMRELSDDSIRSYISTGEPFDKAGAYGIQGMGALLVERIEGCYFNVVGLPLMRLSRMLEEFDFKIL